MDYYIQPITNCFHRDTKIITSDGVKSFLEIGANRQIEVIDRNGQWKKAVVKTYGTQMMYKILLRSHRTEQEIIATKDHRWILRDGTSTTNLEEGDKLLLTPEVEEPKDDLNAKMFILGMIIGDGCDRPWGTEISLFGKKKQYVDLFKENGYKIKYANDKYNSIICTYKGAQLKQAALNGQIWNIIDCNAKRSLFEGYYATDGNNSGNRLRCGTTDKRIAEMIKATSCTAGYYLYNYSEGYRKTNFRESYFYNFKFIKKQIPNFVWTVKSIIPYGPREAWCVEQPETHSFLLDKGIVTGNCGLLNLEDMLENGTMVANAMIDKPKSLRTAATVATQIIASVASNQYGGITMSMAHLAPYVDISRQKYIKEVEQENIIYNLNMSEDVIKEVSEDRLKKEIKDSIQIINYQLNSYNTTAGQTPFITVFCALCEAKNEQEKHDLAMLIEELLKQRIKGMKNKDGVFTTQTFPKLIYVLEEENIKEDSEFYYLTELAAKCTAKRMVPDYMSRKKLEEVKGAVIPVMGCRSAINIDYSPQIYGKFNIGVVSINLPYIALMSEGNPDKFWELLDKYMNVLYRAQMLRVKKLKGTKARVAPILWSYGAYARLKEDEVIDKLLTKEHSTISIGYIGLFEAVKYMSGKSHTDKAAKKFALDILKKMNTYAKKWTKETDLGWGIYGTPAESLTYKFAKACVRDFGTVDGEHKNLYLTNSYHVHVKEPIDAFNKLEIESEFQELSTGGAISYIETPNLQNNIPAVIAVLKYIYEHIMYAELNCKSDYCYECGYEGEMKSFNLPDGSFGWECPECGNKNQERLSVIRRTCGNRA